MSKRLQLEPLDPRDLPAVTVSTPAEAYTWAIINDMGQDPAAFADQLDGLRRGTVPTAFGFSKTDPVVGDMKRLLSFSSYPGRYAQAMNMLRSSPKLGSLGGTTRWRRGPKPIPGG